MAETCSPHDIFISWMSKKATGNCGHRRKKWEKNRTRQSHSKGSEHRYTKKRIKQQQQKRQQHRQPQQPTDLNYELEKNIHTAVPVFTLSLSDDCYNLIMFWTIVRNIINGNWMMSWDCNTSQSIFNAGMSFRYWTSQSVVILFFGADHYAFNHCSWFLFPSHYLFSLVFFFSHHFSFFRHSLHVISSVDVVVFFFWRKNAIKYTGWVWNICFMFAFTFCFKLSSQRAINEIQTVKWNAHECW